MKTSTKKNYNRIQILTQKEYDNIKGVAEIICTSAECNPCPLYDKAHKNCMSRTIYDNLNKDKHEIIDEVYNANI